MLAVQFFPDVSSSAIKLLDRLHALIEINLTAKYSILQKVQPTSIIPNRADNKATSKSLAHQNRDMVYYQF